MSIAEKLITIAESQQRVAQILEDCNNHIGAREIEEAANLSALPDKVAEMYDRGEQSGYNIGHNDGYSEGYISGYSDGQQAGGGGGYDEGKQAAYDEFWDTYQNNGERLEHNFAFAGIGWTNETCKPKYDMQPTKAHYMFAGSKLVGDLDEILGVELDFSQCETMSYTFYQMYGNRDIVGGTVILGTVDLSSANDVTSVFNGTGISTIKALVPPSIDMKNTCFQSGLKYLTVVGWFTESVNLSRCNQLTDESVQSVLDHLADLTGQTAKTLTLHSTVSGRLTVEQLTAAEAKNWNIA